MKKKIALLMVAAALLSGTLSGCSGNFPQVVLNMNSVGKNDVFAINGADCSKEEARLYLCNYQNIYGYEYGIDLWNYDFGDIPEEETLTAYVKEVALVELTNVFCMNQLAQESGITLTDEEMELISQLSTEYYETLSKDEIRYIGLDKGKLKEFYKKYAIAQKYYRTLTENVSEEVSDDEARVILLQQIFVTNASDAATIEQQLAEGTGFGTLYNTYNEAENGEIYLARNTYTKEVDAVVFNLDNDEISGKIQTDDGYYFFKCLNKYVEDMTEANKENIIVQRRKEQFDNAFATFIENSDFDLNEKLWNKMELDTSGTITTDSFFKLYDKYFES